jgi:orotidine-5'-phosphate decarboxylase
MLKTQLGKGCMTVTPGIRPQWSLTPGDDQKRVVTPAKAVQAGSDYIVIGRPIRDADDPARAAEKVALEIETGLSGDPGE